MSATFINPPGVAPSAGYNHAVARTGFPLFLTGQIALDEGGELVGKDDIEVQVAQVWRNIARCCSGVGGSLSDIVKITTFAIDRAHLSAIGAERRKHFPPGELPASTFLVVRGLASPDYLVEIEATLMLKEQP